MLIRSLSNLFLTILFSLALASCGGPTTTTTTPPTVTPDPTPTVTVTLPTDPVVLQYDSATRQLSWGANTDFEFEIENAFDASFDFVAVEKTSANSYSLVETDSGLYRVKICLVDGNCSTTASNEVTAERNNFLFVSPSTIFWDSLTGFDNYRIEFAATNGGSFVSLEHTVNTVLALPATIPSSLRLYVCSGSCESAGKLVDEINLNTAQIAEDWKSENLSFDTELPQEFVGSVVLTTNRIDVVDSALLFGEGGGEFSVSGLNLADFSLSLWFNSTQSSGTFVERRADDNNYWSLELDQNKLFLRINGEGAEADRQLFLGDIVVASDTWHHLFFQYQSTGAVRLGVDGDIMVEALDAVDTAQFGLASGDLRFGGTSAGEGTDFSGKLDDIVILNRALLMWRLLVKTRRATTSIHWC